MEDVLILLSSVGLCDTDWEARRRARNIVCKVSWTFLIGGDRPRGTPFSPLIGSRQHTPRSLIGTRLAHVSVGVVKVILPTIDLPSIPVRRKLESYVSMRVY